MGFDLETLEGKRAVLSIALQAARDASRLVVAGWRKHPVVEHKGAIDLVTAYDRESERFLRQRLLAETPFAFIGEEEGGKPAKEKNAPTWYVDPLDGTTNFVHGHPFFCVSIGLVVGTEPLLGAVVAPALFTEWAGAVGLGATRNGESCAVSEVQTFGDALLATGFPYDRRTSDDNNFDAFVAIKKRVQAVRRCGSAALDLCLVADGTYDGYWERKLKSWDLAAGAAIVRSAGGRLSDFDGSGDDVTSGHLVATNAKIHDALIEALGSVPRVQTAPDEWRGV
jgi:myo-inositol-1(or 4)-monophosphatase